jgi:flagellar biosynthetic protein FliQ
MGADQALNLFNRLLWTAMAVSAPVLVVTLAIGVVVSVLQVATQLQESTLHFIPKMLGAGLVLVAAGPWMIHRVTEFAVYAIKLIPQLS